MSYTQEIFDLIEVMYENHTYKEIAQKINKDFNINTNAKAMEKAYNRYIKGLQKPAEILIRKKTNAPKVLIFDIETSPIEAYVWGLFDNNVALNQIKSDWYVLSWSAKWLGDPPSKVMYMDNRNNKDLTDDKKVLEGIHKLLDEADIAISQNGVSFDTKKLNARFAINKMPPPSPYRQIDTLKIARKYFKFTSNKLEYLTDKLCTKYKKLKHAKYSGFSLWSECLKGNLKAWKEMEKYNKYDVLSLEELYTKLMSWDESINFQVYRDETSNFNCVCGSSSFISNGFKYTNTGKYQRVRCVNCNKTYSKKQNLLSKEKRKGLLGTSGR